MADIKKKLGAKFVSDKRFANFGACVNSISINGFRGVECLLAFEYPVTAITGLNGAGKSTVGQLLLCAYRKVRTSEFKRFYVKDFFPVSVADPEPFKDDASVVFRYQSGAKDGDQTLTVARAVKEWGGYKRQPEKAAIFVGLAFYLPKVERRDLSIYSAKNIVLTDRSEIEDGAMWASRILGNTYSDVFFQGVASSSRSGELSMAERDGARYSENNMGFGEGRVIHTIRLLETCPMQSLVVLEEPETSLHEYAQYEFAKYLLDVSFRRGHQIVFSTHASSMIRAIPPEGRKLLAREANGIGVYDRLSSIHMRNALTEGKDGHLIICVEDLFAQSLLREILHRKKQSLLRRIRILPFGDAKSVKSAVENLTASGIVAIGIRDSDQTEIVSEKLYCLPGNEPPEKLVFLCPSAKGVLKNSYGFDLDQHLAGNPDTDHHDFAKIAAAKANNSREVLEADCIRAVMNDQYDSWADNLLAIIEAAA